MKKDRANPVRFAIVVFQRSVSYVVKNESNNNSKLRKMFLLAWFGSAKAKYLVYESKLTSSTEHV